MAWPKGVEMTKKIFAICVLCSFFSSTLYAQPLSLEQRYADVQATGASILGQLHALIDELDQGSTLKPGDMEAVLAGLRGIKTDIGMASGDLRILASDNSTTCDMIRGVSSTWGTIGLVSATSLLTSVLRLAVMQSNPGVFPERQERKIIWQYVRITGNVIIASVIIPVSIVNVYLASRQYRECQEADL